MREPVRWGVLGTASIALERTIPALAVVETARCVAIASRDADRAGAAAEMLGIPRSYGTYEALLADPDIEAVYVPLPNQLHVEWAGRALGASKAVLCEKPLALTSADVQSLWLGAMRSAASSKKRWSFAITRSGH